MARLRAGWIVLVAGLLAVSAVGILAVGGAAGALGSPRSSAAAPSTTPTYVLSFVEAGLPSGISWTVSLANGSAPPITNDSTSTTVNFTVPNGTYTYVVENATNTTTRFVASPQTGSVEVSGPGASVEFYYVPHSLTEASYNVTFVEQGLPCMTNWSVVIAPSTGANVTGNSTTGSVVFTLTNGTYNFSIASVQTHRGVYVANPASGNVTVDGTNITIDVTFTLQSPSGGCTGMGPSAAPSAARAA